MKEPSEIFSGNMLKINEQNQISSQPLAFQKEPNLLSLNPSVELQNINTKIKIHTNLNKEKENLAETNVISSKETEKKLKGKIKKGVFWAKIIILTLALISFMNIHWINNQSRSYSEKTKVEEEVKIVNKTINDVITFLINHNITIQEYVEKKDNESLVSLINHHLNYTLIEKEFKNIGKKDKGKIYYFFGILLGYIYYSILY